MSHDTQAIALVTNAARKEAMCQYPNPDDLCVLVIVYNHDNVDIQSMAGTDPNRKRMKAALEAAIKDMGTHNRHEPVDME